MENLLERISYLLPPVISNNKFSSSYEVFGALTDDTNKIYVGQNNGNNGNSTGFVIGVKAQSNEVWDMRRSYFVYTEQVAVQADQTVAASTADVELRWESLPMISNGVKFGLCVESVNSSLVVLDCTQDYSKHATGFVLTDNDREARDVGLEAAPHPINGLNFTSGSTLNSTMSSDFKNFKSIISALCVRRKCLRVFCTDGDIGNVRLCVAPLSLYSSLASGKQYLPIGLLSQSSNYGWEVRMELNEDSKNWVIYSPPLVTKYFPESVYYGIKNPKIICRFIKIHDADVLQSLVNDFNFIPRIIPLGETVDENGNVVKEEQTILKSIYFPYNKNIFKRDLLPTNTQDFSIVHNISEKGLKGLQIRFSHPSVDITQSVDYAMNDINMRLENLQINIGDLRIPKISFRIFEGQLTNVSNNVLSVFGCAGSHLFNPFNKFQDLVGHSSWSDPQYTQAPGQPGASNCTFWFSFENLDMIPQESEDTSHSFGVNTFIMGNQIIINGKFSSPASAPVAVHTCYKAQEVLLIGNGQIENVFNKTLVNNVLQIQ